MSFFSEFRDFAVKGNVVDMAVGIIIGAGFGKIVSSVVADIIMPPIGLVIGGVNFTGLKLVLKEAEKIGDKEFAAVTLNYGTCLQTIFDFVIVAFAMFMVIKAMNRIKLNAEKTAPPAKPSDEVVLLGEIRDLLKSR